MMDKYRFRQSFFNGAILQKLINVGGGYDPDCWQWVDVPFGEAVILEIKQ